jgi:hypothetical protein
MFRYKRNQSYCSEPLFKTKFSVTTDSKISYCITRENFSTLEVRPRTGKCGKLGRFKSTNEIYIVNIASMCRFPSLATRCGSVFSGLTHYPPHTPPLADTVLWHASPSISGVLNSNVSEGHIPKKKYSAGLSFSIKLLWTIICS